MIDNGLDIGAIFVEDSRLGFNDEDGIPICVWDWEVAITHNSVLSKPCPPLIKEVFIAGYPLPRLEWKDTLINWISDSWTYLLYHRNQRSLSPRLMIQSEGEITFEVWKPTHNCWTDKGNSGSPVIA